MASRENGGSAAAIARHKSEREKKLGHRRVGTGGEVTYKKASTPNCDLRQLGPLFLCLRTKFPLFYVHRTWVHNSTSTRIMSISICTQPLNNGHNNLRTKCIWIRNYCKV